MTPNIKDGNFFIASSIPLKIYGIKTGDVVLFNKNNKSNVKRVTKLENDKIFTQGDNKLDSRKFGSISQKEILGKVIWIF